MFIIAVFVGIIIGVVGTCVGLALFTVKETNMSLSEIGDCGMLIREAGNNRESTIAVWHDGAMLNMVELEEK